MHQRCQPLLTGEGPAFTKGIRVFRKTGHDISAHLGKWHATFHRRIPSESEDQTVPLPLYSGLVHLQESALVNRAFPTVSPWFPGDAPVASTARCHRGVPPQASCSHHGPLRGWQDYLYECPVWSRLLWDRGMTGGRLVVAGSCQRGCMWMYQLLSSIWSSPGLAYCTHLSSALIVSYFVHLWHLAFSTSMLTCLHQDQDPFNLE